MPTTMTPQITADEPPSTSIFASPGPELDVFDFEDTSEFMMDDLWFLNVPPLDDIGQMPSRI